MSILNRVLSSVPGTRALVAKPTVDGVMAQFNKTISELEAVQQEAERDAAEQSRVMSEALKRKGDALKEAERALTVRAKLQALVTA